MSATLVTPSPTRPSPGSPATTPTPWASVVRARPDTAPVRVALLGTGAVGEAFLARLADVRDGGGCEPTLVHVANSRRSVGAADGLPLDHWAASFQASERPSRLADVAVALGQPGAAPRVVVDATASAAVALHHPYWLERGIHVVTACKIATGGPLSQAWHLAGAAQRGGATYGDSATVGAGLPILRTIRELRRGGDRILDVRGVLSGSLAWLLDSYDGRRPFGSLVEEAQALGYTEPDPRVDLSGEDVRRKLLIITRAAGASLEPADIEVEPLLAPPAGGGASGAPAADRLAADLVDLDARLQRRLGAAHAEGRVLRYVGSWDGRRARVGLEALEHGHPLAAGSGCDNRVAIRSTRYCDSAVVIQGPGAGPGVTAAALWDDVLRVVRG